MHLLSPLGLRLIRIVKSPQTLCSGGESDARERQMQLMGVRLASMGESVDFRSGRNRCFSYSVVQIPFQGCTHSRGALCQFRVPMRII